MSESKHPSIQGLVELARREDADLRPTLLRVLVDLYVQEPVHPPAERARFAELACRLLDSVDAATRAVVAERLAAYPGTPAAVLSRLARDDIRVAEPVLRRAPALGEAAMHSILDSCGIAHAIAIAARTGLPASVSKRLRRLGAGEPANAAPAALPAVRRTPALTLALARRYLATGTAERHRIVAALPACPALPHEERLECVERALGERLERAALRHQSQEFVELLRHATGLPSEIGGRAVTDPTGELVVVVCRALELPFQVASRILLFLNPAVGASVRQVFALADDFEQVAPASARRLFAAWCEIVPAAKAKRTAQPRAARAPNEAAANARGNVRVSVPAVQRAVTPARPASAW